MSRYRWVLLYTPMGKPGLCTSFRQLLWTTVSIGLITLGMVPSAHLMAADFFKDIKTGDDRSFEADLKARPDLATLKNPEGYLPIEVAVAFGRALMVRKLLDRGIDPNTCGIDGSSILQIAWQRSSVSEYGDVYADAIVAELIERGARFDALAPPLPAKEQAVAIYLATGDDRPLRRVLEDTQTPSFAYRFGSRALGKAIRMNDLDLTEHLWSTMYDLDQYYFPKKYNVSAAVNAVTNPQMVELIATLPQGSDYLSCRAIVLRNPDAVRTLVTHGAQPNRILTLLSIDQASFLLDQPDLLEFLFDSSLTISEHGHRFPFMEDPFERGQYYRYLVEIAAMRQDTRSLQVLLDHGVEPDSSQAMEAATESVNSGAIHMLCNYGWQPIQMDRAADFYWSYRGQIYRPTCRLPTWISLLLFLLLPLGQRWIRKRKLSHSSPPAAAATAFIVSAPVAPSALAQVANAPASLPAAEAMGWHAPQLTPAEEFQYRTGLQALAEIRSRVHLFWIATLTVAGMVAADRFLGSATWEQIGSLFFTKTLGPSSTKAFLQTVTVPGLAVATLVLSASALFRYTSSPRWSRRAAWGLVAAAGAALLYGFGLLVLFAVIAPDPATLGLIGVYLVIGIMTIRLARQSLRLQSTLDMLQMKRGSPTAHDFTPDVEVPPGWDQQRRL